jgi:hypothetical protein
MGFELVYHLAYRMFPKGHICTGRGDGSRHSSCPSNDHSNGTDYRRRRHSDGGYALRQAWI